MADYYDELCGDSDSHGSVEEFELEKEEEDREIGIMQCMEVLNWLEK
jgi:hypothetical protein